MTALPHGLVLTVGRKVRVRDGGATLVGGAPLRAVHLSAAARALIDGGRLTVTEGASARLADHLLAAGLAGPETAGLADLAPAEVTCVVPVRDQPAGLARLLAGLHDVFRVIVVDDASVGPAPIAAVAARHRAQLVRLDTNLGPAGARNVGLGLVDTAYVLFVDSDVTVDARAILRLGRHLQDPGLAVVAPRVVGGAGCSRRLAAYESVRSSLDLGCDGGLVHPQSRIGWLPSACLLARTSALGEGFDAKMRVGEDVDLVWRLIAGGWRVRYEPAVVAQHADHRPLPAWLARKAFYGTGGAPLAVRHGSTVAPAALSPLGVAIGLAALAQRRWSAPAVLVLSAVMMRRLSRSLRHSAHPTRLAAELTWLGSLSIFGQVTALMLRHWWPLTAMAAVVSHRARRALLLAAAADSVVEYARTRPGLDPLSFAILRRMDDLAYGAGLWVGVVRGRSVRALLPRLR
ncbi:mycofactocin biosynthesis glycosyltransferase MftF [Leekyejoonella antrihumi]|uniref:Mycofactocin system glycosyltransferase n=1 Tax=Leekyejoonella antrihumi TaxID=1660198 RepID=A0A563DVC9_9MICO|nr:mycofactocin biosynthesis glycosyltransferase MftF [Leekyejoonella antrihumi]TWP34218.1 mycofactocin system glycosyltransferase [Leekyejoonella antrihumi]